MTSLGRLIIAEFLKTKRSMALWLCLAAPMTVGVTLFMLVLGRGSSIAWLSVQSTGIFMWSFFMLPMSATALAALIGQIEYTARGWSYLLVTPRRRAAVFAAKASVALALTLLMSTVALLIIPLAGALADLLRVGHHVTGQFGMTHLLVQGGKSVAAGLALSVLQIWLALRFRSFIPALIVGVVGTFATVVVYASKYALVIPWALPANAIGADEARSISAIVIGLAIGIIAFILMILDLSRKEFP